MTAKSAGEIVGLEFDWLACDADGHVGFFSTAGGGCAPEAFLRDTDAFDAAIEAILAGPASTLARFAPDLAAGLENTWLSAAGRGLFAFDADAHGGPYRLVAAPAAPVHVDQLPAAAREVVRRLHFRQIHFSSCFELSKDDLLPRR